jgi:hypothetical protein
MKLQYVRQTGNTLGFNRHYPTHLQAVTISKQFTYPMGRADQSELEIERAYLLAKEAYAAECERASGSNGNSFNDAKVEAMARKLLRAQGYSEGQVSDFSVSNESLKALEQTREHDVPSDPTSKAEEIVNNMPSSVSSLDDIMHKDQLGVQLTLAERVTMEQWSLLQEKPEVRQKRIKKQKQQQAKLSDLWEAYALYRGDSALTSAPITKRWNLFVSLVGDLPTNVTVMGHLELSSKLNKGLEEYKNLRLTKVRGSTTRREMNDIKACLMHFSGIYGWMWIFSRTKIGRMQAGPVAVKIPLSIQHQQKLVKYCCSPEHRDEPTSTMALLYLTSIMFSEVQRMDLAAAQLSLSHPTSPYLIIDGITKTVSRKRVVPITIGHAVVAAGIAGTLEWFKTAGRGKRLWDMKKMLRAATGCDDYSSHCLRHTFALNCTMNSNVRDMDKINIGGWSASKGAGANTKINLDYGVASIEPAKLMNLYKASQEIHKHLL